MWVFLASSDRGSVREIMGVLSAILGLFTLHMFYQENMVFIVMLAILVFPLLSLTHSRCRGRAGVSVSVVTLVYLLTW